MRDRLAALDHGKKAAAGPGLVPGVGWVLSGQRTVENNKIQIDTDHRAVVLRLIEDYTNRGARATAATLSWSKSRDNGTETAINAALLLDFVEPHSHLSPSVGIQVNRSGTGDSRRDARKIFLLGEEALGAGHGFFEGGLLGFGPVYETDEVSHLEKLTGLIEFEPLLRFRSYPTGAWVPFSGRSAHVGDWESFIAPRVAIELSHVTRRPPLDPDPAKNPETADLVRYGLIAGLRAHKQLTLQYSLYKRHTLRNFKARYLYQEVIAEWAFDQEGAYTLTGSYKHGEDSPDFRTVNDFNVGFGIKF